MAAPRFSQRRMVGKHRSWSKKGIYRLRLTATESYVAAFEGLRQLRVRISDWRPAFVEVAKVLAGGVEQNIRSRGASLGFRWPASDPKYAMRKARAGHGRIDLVVSRKLVDDVTSPDGIIELGHRLLIFGTDVPYARAVNFGFTPRSGRRAIQERRFFGYSESMKSRAADAFAVHMQRAVDEARARMASDTGGA